MKDISNNKPFDVMDRIKSSVGMGEFVLRFSKTDRLYIQMLEHIGIHAHVMSLAIGHFGGFAPLKAQRKIFPMRMRALSPLNQAVERTRKRVTRMLVLPKPHTKQPGYFDTKISEQIMNYFPMLKMLDGMPSRKYFRKDLMAEKKYGVHMNELSVTLVPDYPRPFHMKHAHHHSFFGSQFLPSGGSLVPAFAPTKSTEHRFDRSNECSQNSQLLAFHSDTTQFMPTRQSEAPSRRYGEIHDVITDILDRQTRLPSSGMTMFDPRLTPAWPGLKIPY